MAMVQSWSTGSLNSIAWGHIFVVSLVKSKHANKATAIRNDKRRITVCGPIYCFPFLGPDTFVYDYFSQLINFLQVLVFVIASLFSLTPRNLTVFFIERIVLS